MFLSLAPLLVLVNHACGDLSCLSVEIILWSAAQEPCWINTEEYHSKKASVPSTVSFCNRNREREFWSEVSHYDHYAVPFLRCFQHLPTVEFTLRGIVFPTAEGGACIKGNSPVDDPENEQMSYKQSVDPPCKYYQVLTYRHIVQ